MKRMMTGAEVAEKDASAAEATEKRAEELQLQPQLTATTVEAVKAFDAIEAANAEAVRVAEAAIDDELLGEVLHHARQGDRSDVRLVMFSGPQGQSCPMGKYETVVMVADSTGIAAQLPYLKRLIHGHHGRQEVNSGVLSFKTQWHALLTAHPTAPRLEHHRTGYTLLEVVETSPSLSFPDCFHGS